MRNDKHRGGIQMNDNYKYPNIEAERVKNKLTQQELTEELGIERKTYYNWQINGKMPVTHLVAIADLFNCSVDYLLGRTHTVAMATA